jgi:two-component system, LytTR family, sensor histidine kinase AlgZ
MHPILAERQRLLAYVTAWELLGVLLAALLVVTGPFSWLQALAMPLCLFYGFACLGAFWVCQSTPVNRTMLTRVAGTQVAAGALSGWVLYLVTQSWAGLHGRTGFLSESLIQFIGGAAPLVVGLGLVLYLLVAALHYLLAAFEESRQAEAQALRFQLLSRDAELRALRAQIHPHFLFNALNSISALVTSRPEEARRVCILLADFLRRSLTLGTRDRVTFGDELALAEDLLAIEKVRFGERLRHESEVEEATRSIPVPPLLLQPLVENAITHGIAQCLDGGVVRLVAERRGERLRVVIENPRDPDTPGRKGTGIGLQNVRRRLDAVYGREADLRVQADGATFRVELSLPASPEPSIPTP